MPLLIRQLVKRDETLYSLSKLFTNLKFKSMSKKTAEPRKNKPTKKKSSAQKKADPKKKAR